MADELRPDLALIAERVKRNTPKALTRYGHIVSVGSGEYFGGISITGRYMLVSALDDAKIITDLDEAANIAEKLDGSIHTVTLVLNNDSEKFVEFFKIKKTCPLTCSECEPYSCIKMSRGET